MPSSTLDLLARFSAVSRVAADVVGSIAAHWAPHEPPLTVAMGGIARSLIDRADQLREAELCAVFDVVETILSTGTQPEQDAVATGLLEALLAAADRNTVSGARVLSFAGPKAAEYLRAWNAFTRGDLE
jgi:hypothetical protein